MMEGLINMFNPSADQYAARMLPLFTAPELSAHKGTSFGQKGTGMSFSVCLSHFLVVSVRFCFAITARLLVLPYCCDPSQSFKLHLTYFTLFLFFLLSLITAILPTKEFAADSTLASKWMAAADALAKKALSTSSTKY